MAEPPAGPVALLLDSLHSIGASMGSDLIIHIPGEASINMETLNLNQIRKLVEQAADGERVGEARVGAFPHPPCVGRCARMAEPRAGRCPGELD